MPHTARTRYSAAARRELRLIAEHRTIATGDLRVALMGVEARWAIHGAWLCEDTGDRRGRLALLAKACADAGELDRARTEGRRALVIARTTTSHVAARELKQLTATLNA
jgi:hypothetical protein